MNVVKLIFCYFREKSCVESEQISVSLVDSPNSHHQFNYQVMMHHKFNLKHSGFIEMNGTNLLGKELSIVHYSVCTNKYNNTVYYLGINIVCMATICQSTLNKMIMTLVIIILTMTLVIMSLLKFNSLLQQHDA